MVPFVLFLVFAFIWSNAMPSIKPPFVLPMLACRRPVRALAWSVT